MAKSGLYQISGHWDHYKDGMFVLGDEEKDKEVFALRPMTCPFQYMIYNAEHHPIRICRSAMAKPLRCFRNEASGEMHGRHPCASVYALGGAYYLYARAA